MPVCINSQGRIVGAGNPRRLVWRFSCGYVTEDSEAVGNVQQPACPVCGTRTHARAEYHNLRPDERDRPRGVCNSKPLSEVLAADDPQPQRVPEPRPMRIVPPQGGSGTAPPTTKPNKIDIRVDGDVWCVHGIGIGADVYLPEFVAVNSEREGEWYLQAVGSTLPAFRLTAAADLATVLRAVEHLTFFARVDR